MDGLFLTAVLPLVAVATPPGDAPGNGQTWYLVDDVRKRGSSVGAVKANFFHALQNLKRLLSGGPLAAIRSPHADVSHRQVEDGEPIERVGPRAYDLEASVVRHRFERII